ncbi:MAG TPA: sensor histidine kinase [Acidobacteriaceae bacterium]
MAMTQIKRFRKSQLLETGDQPIVFESRSMNSATWLFYLGFWFIQPFYAHDRRQWLYLALAVAFFIPLYFGSIACGRRRRLLCTAAICAIALVYVPYNESAFGIYFYLVWLFANVVEGDAAFFRVIGLQRVVICAQAWAFHLGTWEWSIGIGVSALSAVNAVRMRQGERANAKLRMAHTEIEQLAKTAERERIARDLHDLLGHTLSLIVIKSELAGKLFASHPERAARELHDIEQTARRALSEVRETVSGYRSVGLSDELLQAAQTLEAAGVKPQVPTMAPRLQAQHEATLALVLREAVTNVVRHAGARHCRVEIDASNNTTRLVVEDDGRGRIEREGNGLRGMRERIVALGGSLKLDSAMGTRIEVALPPQAQ